MRKLRLREVKSLAEGCTDLSWWTHSLDPELLLLTTMKGVQDSVFIWPQRIMNLLMLIRVN